MHWLSSLPQKYRDEIVDHLLKSNMELNQEHQYKIVVDLLGDFQKRLRKEMELLNSGMVNHPDPIKPPQSQLIRELVGNNPRLEGLNPYQALN